ncbi:MAG: hypothetical protein ACHQ4H_11560 [Ktedonobacterales bacterium]
MREECDKADAEVVHIALPVALPCGMPGCRREALHALAEPDPACPGMWMLLPMCPHCQALVARPSARSL